MKTNTYIFRAGVFHDRHVTVHALNEKVARLRAKAVLDRRCRHNSVAPPLGWDLALISIISGS
jgi:hypothetical protein